MQKNNKKIREAILKYAKEKVDNANKNIQNKDNIIMLEGYYISTTEVFDAIDSLVHINGYNLSDIEKTECLKMLREDECFKYDGYNLTIVKVPLEFKLSQKYNIVVKTISDNLVKVCTASMAVLAVPLTIGMVQLNNDYQKALLTDNGKEYLMKDIYVVSDENNIHFCNRRENQTKAKSINPIYYLNKDGKYDIYPYYVDVDEFYDYFDIENGHKICSSDNEKYHIENLLELYTINELEHYNYKVDINEVKKNINNDYVLSNDTFFKSETKEK